MANTEMWKSILCELLDCGYLDLDILDDADEDYVLEAIENLRFEGLEISLNAITSEMFWRAGDDIASAVENRKEELQGFEAEMSITDDECEELEAIEELNPDEDIEWFCNCLDTSIYIVNDKYDVYKKYFGDLLDELESKMGFEFGC
jgi:hypothetical protein